jgi:hyperosmotically inducible periplasmic protein
MTTIRYALALGCVLALMACNKAPDDQSAGQKVDAAIAKVDASTDAAKAQIERSAEDAKKSAGEATQAAATAMSDAALTVGVKASLAGDPELKATDIEVDTVSGRTALHGKAPNSAARERATQLASAVAGVQAVDNQLTVAP